MANYRYPDEQRKLMKNKHCNKCQYRMTGVAIMEGQYGCEYILHTGKRRGCPASKCTHWKDGKIKSKKAAFNRRPVRS